MHHGEKSIDMIQLVIIIHPSNFICAFFILCLLKAPMPPATGCSCYCVCNPSLDDAEEFAILGTVLLKVYNSLCKFLSNNLRILFNRSFMMFFISFHWIWFVKNRCSYGNQCLSKSSTKKSALYSSMGRSRKSIRNFESENRR